MNRWIVAAVILQGSLSAAGAQANSPEFPIQVRVVASESLLPERNGLASLVLDTEVGGKAVRLTNTDEYYGELLEPGVYAARDVPVKRNKRRPAFLFARVYEMKMPDGTTLKFQVTRVATLPQNR